jgi:uroporphyrinogen decarboxylase
MPERPVLFELGLNGRLVKRFAEPGVEEDWSSLSDYRILAHRNAGYDYCIVAGSGFGFPKGERQKASSVSLNQGALITDRQSFRAYDWPDPDDFDYCALAGAEPPEGMKLIPWAPGGVLENVVWLVGFERLCYMVADDPALAGEVFEAVGARLVRYFDLVSGRGCVGAVMLNDDWGFKTQTMLAPRQMRRYVIPWHRRIVEKIHQAGRPAILHCCGNVEAVMEDIIEEIGFDALHSFEDAIEPVERAYERWGGRIAILGGIDVDFLARSTPARVRERSRAMLGRAARRGGYALGSGNSIPEYVPDENYLAMTSVAFGSPTP